MKDFSTYTDEQLVLLGREGNHQAMDEVINRYKSIVRKKANTLFLAGADSDDLLQEGMIGLYQAYRDFDPEKKAAFKTFAGICISGQMHKAIEAAGRDKHLPLNKYVSLFSEEAEGSEENMAARFDAENGNDPEELYIDRENVKALVERIKKILSPLEWEVFFRYVNGLTIRQIAEELGKNEKAIGNARDRIRTKITKEING